MCCSPENLQVKRQHYYCKTGFVLLPSQSSGKLPARGYFHNYYRGGHANRSGQRPVTGLIDFVDEASMNFHLQSTSTAVNAGIAVTFPGGDKDFDLSGRLQGDAPDIGAYEFDRVSNVPSPLSASPATPTPVATSNSVTLSWSATGDDGNSGTAARYDIRYLTVHR